MQSKNQTKQQKIQGTIQGENGTMNLMKHTSCKVCGKNFDNCTYDSMMKHISRHAAAHQGQKLMEEF